MRNREDVATTASGLDLRLMSIASDTNSLRAGALPAAIAPISASDFIAATNGCISEISSDAIRGYEHDYAAAMKNYADVYEKYQAYLMPAEQLLPHDYDLAATTNLDIQNRGCFNSELFTRDTMLQHDNISDDDIENCGYMAWVRH